jgi:hypothetical protein
MRVKALANAADGARSWYLGDTIEVADALGRTLIAEGFAEVVLVPAPLTRPAWFDEDLDI